MIVNRAFSKKKTKKKIQNRIKTVKAKLEYPKYIIY